MLLRVEISRSLPTFHDKKNKCSKIDAETKDLDSICKTCAKEI